MVGGVDFLRCIVGGVDFLRCAVGGVDLLWCTVGQKLNIGFDMTWGKTRMLRAFKM